MTCTGDGPGGEDRPAQNAQPDPAKVRDRARASLAQQDHIRCDCDTYCAECQLWPLRAALGHTWRAGGSGACGMTSVRALPAPAGPAAPVGSTVMEASHYLDVSLRLRLAAYREGYKSGRDRGLREGYEYAMREMERRWRAIAQPVSRGGLSYAELEARRYGSAGRECFGEPRPGDYKGKAT
jgi:hypothetical protein